MNKNANYTFVEEFDSINLMILLKVIVLLKINSTKYSGECWARKGSE